MFNFFKTCNVFSSGSEDESLDEIPLMPNNDQGFDMDESDSLMKPRRYRPYGQSRLSYYCTQFWENCCARY